MALARKPHSQPNPKTHDARQTSSAKRESTHANASFSPKRDAAQKKARDKRAATADGVGWGG